MGMITIHSKPPDLKPSSTHQPGTNCNSLHILGEGAGATGYFDLSVTHKLQENKTT
jgi:hypothetical protein